MKKFLTLSMLLISVLLGGSRVMADEALFTFNSSSAPTTVDAISITGGTPGSNGYNASSTISVNAATGNTITAIAFTFAANSSDRNGGTVTVSSGTYAPDGANTTTSGSWSGSANAVTFTPSGKFRIKAMTVTYTNNTTGDKATSINISDLRFEHQTYDPSRSGVRGFNITTSGWQSYTTVGSPNVYTLLLTNMSSNSITVSTTNSAKIKQFMLVGAGGVNTFNNATVTSANTRKTTTTTEGGDVVGVIVWENASGATSATISFTSTDRPHVYSLYIITDTEMPTTKQSVVLSFDPSTGTAGKGLTDFSIDGRVKASIAGGTPEYFRADDFTSSSVTNSGSNAEFNQFHLSTGYVGVNTGSTAGTATITAKFTGNDYYEAATSGTYTLSIQDNSTKTLAVSVDDMRISKKGNANGLNATSGFDRVMGGFKFDFDGGDNVKFNNDNYLIFRNSGGKVTITPQKKEGETGDIKITRVDINTISSYTNGVVTVSGLDGDKTINGVSSYSFANLKTEGYDGVTDFTMTSSSGNIYVTGFTIYYTDPNGALNSEKVTPRFTFTPDSHTVNKGDTYTSPAISAYPDNFDFDITTDNANVANVGTTGGEASGLIALQGGIGTAHITARAGESTFFNAAEDATYTVTVNSTNAKKWDFTTLDVTNTIGSDATEWKSNGEYYNNQFTTSATTNGAAIASGTAYWTTSKTSSQIYELLFGRQNSSGLNTGNIRLYSSYLTANNSAVVIAVPATEGQKVIVTFDGGNGTTQQGFDFTNATLEGDASATSIKSDETQRVATLTAGAGGYITLKFTTSKVRLYSIEVSDETRKTLTLADVNNTYERAVSETTFSHHVKFTASDGATDALSYDSDKDYLHITSSNENVLKVTPPEVSAADFGSGSSFAFDGIKAVGPGTATLTITFDGNNEYKPTSYTSQVYTVSGTMTAFTVTADDQSIQQGQRSPIEPMITNANGQLIGIRGTSGNYETYVLGDEDDIPNYADFFDFTYTAGSGSGTNYNNITVTDGTVYVADGVGIGATRNIAITATVKEQYNSAFGGTSVSANATMTVTVRAKTSGNPCTYYWNSNLTDNQVTATDYSTEEGSSMGIFGKNESGKTFASGFPNGRVMYVKPNNADDVVFFSYAVNGEPGDFPAQPKYDKDKKIYIYRRGIPIYIDEDFTNGSSYVRVNVATASYDASTKKYTLNSGVVKMKFIMTTHERPDQPTYDPISPASEPTLNQDGRRIMNTAQNVVAYGDGASKGVAGSNNLVYGKFSTSSVYTTAQLINEETVSEGRDNVPVISTEVNKRRFTAVQIKNYTGVAEPCGYGDYISEQTYTEYYYLYDTEMRLTPASVNISPNTSVPSNNAPQVTVTWYNKKNGAKQEVETYDGKISYAITGAYNLTYGQESGNDVSVDATTGIVTSSTDKQGWVKVTATYAGGEEHGDKTGEPQYKSTTDKSTADFYVYIYDTSKQRPTITPTTRNFTGTMTYTITAPEDWDVVYTTDGTDPEVPAEGTTPTENYIAHNANPNYHQITIGDVTTEGNNIHVDIDGTHIVKAIAYNPDDRTSSSAVVSESYTRKAPLPDPVFDPDGTDKDKNGSLDVYQYNTSTLTVQIACAYAGSEIYYTTDGTTPEIGNENTYKYSGLSKVVISGDVTIKAVAYDPANKIFSNIVPSGYRYSDKMEKPYFQISDNGGSTWYGFSDATTWAQNGTAWNNGQSHEITPSTQIRIVDPNPVAGTIYYTLDGSAPSNDASSFVYFEGYPFTVGKNTTGKAITTLEDASSEPATAEFTIKSSFGNVWEAVDETMTGETKHKGIHADDGFVISTVASLAVANTGTTVNKYSIKGETNAQGATNNVSFAQADITATFGGYDLASWEEMDIADKATGAPIGNVGKYSIKNISNTGIGNGNARDESNKNYNHIYSYKTDADKAKAEVETPATTHEKTFKIPAIGDYVRFEPEKDGDLTIWCLQQGALLYEDDKYFIPNVLRIRPVYLVDEQGKSYHVKTINGVPQLWSSARLSENWTKIQETAADNSWMDSHLNSAGTDMEDNELYVQYLRYSDGALFQDKPGDYKEDPSKYKYMLNKGPNKAETAAIYNLYKADLDKNHVNVGDPIKPFALHTGSNLSLNAGMYIDNSDDGTGYVLASGGFAKYTFEVKAGKTYYFFAQGSKIGIRGFQFVPTETGTRHAVTITKTGESYTVDSETKTPAEAIAECADKPADVTLSGRTFAADTWASLVLPFSVSVAQVEKVFGAHTDIIHFNDIKTWGDGYKLYMKRHWHKMIVAGTPILIKPTQPVENPTFHGVQLEASDVTDMNAATVSDQYKMTGVLVKTDGALRKDDYYINTSGKLTHMNAASSNVNATYAWIKYLGVPNQAKSLTVSITDFENEMIDDDETTGIQVALFEESGINTFGSDDNVYNLNGMKVADGASLNNLPKGIYIVKGKKVIVK